MYVRVHIYEWLIYSYAFMHLCIYVLYVFTYMIHLRTYILMSQVMRVCTYVFLCICMCLRTYILSILSHISYSIRSLLMFSDEVMQGRRPTVTVEVPLHTGRWCIIPDKTRVTGPTHACSHMISSPWSPPKHIIQNKRFLNFGIFEGVTWKWSQLELHGTSHLLFPSPMQSCPPPDRST